MSFRIVKIVTLNKTNINKTWNHQGSKIMIMVSILKASTGKVSIQLSFRIIRTIKSHKISNQKILINIKNQIRILEKMKMLIKIMIIIMINQSHKNNSGIMKHKKLIITIIKLSNIHQARCS